MPIDDASRAKKSPPGRSTRQHPRTIARKCAWSSAKWRTALASTASNAAVVERERLQALDPEVLCRQLRGEPAGHRPDLRDRARVGVDRGHVEAVAQEVREVAPAAAARVEHARARAAAGPSAAGRRGRCRSNRRGPGGRRAGRACPDLRPGLEWTRGPRADRADLRRADGRARQPHPRPRRAQVAVRDAAAAAGPARARRGRRARSAGARSASASPLPAWEPAGRREDPDGTTKIALRLGQATVETVLIPADGRSTVCVSSQAGCTRHCRFCATATLGFQRQLTAGGDRAAVRDRARGGAAPTGPRATWCSWAWASRSTTSTRCCARSRC